MSIASSPAAASRSVERLAAEAITSLEALEAVRDEWQALWHRAQARPFQSPAWLIPWWKHVGRGRLACVAIRHADRLVGFAPLYVFEDGQRHLFPLGIATTDYLDVLAQPGREDDVLRTLAWHLDEHRDEWDMIEAPQLHEQSLLLHCRFDGAWQRHTSECEPNPVLPLASRVPASMARGFTYAQRRLARAGHVDCVTASANDIDTFLDALARLHTRRWALRDLPGVLGSESVLAWHRESAPRLHSLGLLRLLALCFERRIIAVLYCIADAPQLARRRWYDYIGGFDPQFASFSPGTLLVGHAIELARAEGATHFDFLRGGESYKYRWGALDQPMFALRVTRSARPA